ncbi:MAG: alpha-glucuronidase [Rikenellaceae bacterium]|jgi:alpha-glucuronidase|nr:alpha-glucuronidase [Rikenellaceae bacterium]
MNKTIRKAVLLCLSLCCGVALSANDGSSLWLDYQPLSAQESQKAEYTARLTAISYQTDTPTIQAAIEELQLASEALLAHAPQAVRSNRSRPGEAVLAFGRDRAIGQLKATETLSALGEDGYLIRSADDRTYILANSDKGVLYGAFHLIRLMQTRQDISALNLAESPAYDARILNHWDNLDRSVERGYAGASIWEWEALPGTVSDRYKMYARANAAVGINGSVLNNVNANANFITPAYLEKIKVLADIFRPYGIRVYLSINFNSPQSIGGLDTSDPLDPRVRGWWKDKAKEIYGYIPDFGGFLVKANSEGQPGPQDYGRTHVDGANMLAEALKPYGGLIMWRAFVYTVNATDPSYDRAMQSYLEFVPLDGQFADNVIVQVKNGPIDFQPREPINSLFGAMKETPLMIEFQITQEYLGHSIQLAYLAPMYKETLDQDTYCAGPGSTVAKVTDGGVYPIPVSAIAGVANTGTDANWTGHIFAQSNWYGFGRLAWNPELTSDAIADEWIRMTFTNDPEFVAPVKGIMMASHEAAVNYMQPLGLHHIFAGNHHYGPGVWERLSQTTDRPDWVPEWYHRADSLAIGFDRTTGGTGYVSQYFSPLKELYNNIETCPENLLLFFHRVSWDYRMKNGRTLWDEMCYKYTEGLDAVRGFQKDWDRLEGKIDPERFRHVQYKLREQTRDAIWWRDGVLLYFQSLNHKPIPYELERPINTLELLMRYRIPGGNSSVAPGARPLVMPTSPMAPGVPTTN